MTIDHKAKDKEVATDSLLTKKKGRHLQIANCDGRVKHGSTADNFSSQTMTIDILRRLPVEVSHSRLRENTLFDSGIDFVRIALIRVIPEPPNGFELLCRRLQEYITLFQGNLYPSPPQGSWLHELYEYLHKSVALSYLWAHCF